MKEREVLKGFLSELYPFCQTIDLSCETIEVSCRNFSAPCMENEDFALFFLILHNKISNFQADIFRFLKQHPYKASRG